MVTVRPHEVVAIRSRLLHHSSLVEEHQQGSYFLVAHSPCFEEYWSYHLHSTFVVRWLVAAQGHSRSGDTESLTCPRCRTYSIRFGRSQKSLAHQPGQQYAFQTRSYCVLSAPMASVPCSGTCTSDGRRFGMLQDLQGRFLLVCVLRRCTWCRLRELLSGLRELRGCSLYSRAQSMSLCVAHTSTHR